MEYVLKIGKIYHCELSAIEQVAGQQAKTELDDHGGSQRDYMAVFMYLVMFG